MAEHTDQNLLHQVIYSVFVRNHTKEGTFRSLEGDLDRLKGLGADIIWLMPIHPIGSEGRKGTLGSPYAIQDYRGINPEYGTLDDFKALVDAIHARGMKCIIDVVYNHTSPDAVYVTEHPEFYYRKPDGRFGNKTADWTDVIDLDYSCAALWDAQIQHLCYWAGIVDGFRCDVASLVPVEFWKKAREAVEKVHPGCIWLAESVHRSFLVFNRLRGITAATDNELYEAFDMEYEYDIRETFDKYIAGEQPLSAWMDMLGFQEAIYPENYVKLRYMENHDMPRIAGLVPDEKARRNFTALLYFLKGTVLLYGGRLYFVWSGWESRENTHQNIYIAPMKSPTELCGARVLLSTPEYDWEKRGSGPTKSGKCLPAVNEGPQVLEKDGTVHIIYSAAGSWCRHYCLGRLTFRGGDPLDPKCWEKCAEPVFTEGEGAHGPGHCSFVKAADGKTDFIIYHARRDAKGGWVGRGMRAQPFTWDGDVPVFGKAASPEDDIEIPV